MREVGQHHDAHGQRRSLLKEIILDEKQLDLNAAFARPEAREGLKYKIFPRNLTARADYIVAGNPTSSRPEAGVDNCYPGLEFDQRNLEQQFFPGLTFYFHRWDGARLIDIHLTDAQKASGLTAQDLAGPPLYLWGMLARHLVQDKQPSMFGFEGQSGMEVWRRVRDLLPGPVAIIFGPAPGVGINFTDDLQALVTKAYSAIPKGPVGDRYQLSRDEKGAVEHVVFADQRAAYLDEEGVIDVNTYAPGEITKTMCAPWMYDFRDCYCFYWSSNKPDIVKVPYNNEVQPYVNFLRRVEDRAGPPKPDVNYYWKMVDGKKVQRRDLELTYENMVDGWWQKLPVVLNDTETADASASPMRAVSAASQQLEQKDIVKELAYLATVEHALTVEYLYAFYSINSDWRPRREAHSLLLASANTRISAAASQVFQIAVDEMRHLMWANLALHLLGSGASVGRAQRIAEPPDPAKNGRKRLTGVDIDYLNKPFALNRLDQATLDWFIHVEQPSAVINEGLDGMYVYVLEALQLRKAEIPNAERVIPMVKLIIDEGEGHWQRFELIKKTLDGIPEKDYLRPIRQEAPSPEQNQYLKICDSYYHVLLHAIELSLTLGAAAQSQLMASAVRMMMSLDDMAVVLARQGVLPRFKLPPKKVRRVPWKRLPLAASLTAQHAKALRGPDPSAPLADLESTYGHLDYLLHQLRQEGSSDSRLLVAKDRERLAQHIAEVDSIVTVDLHQRSQPR